MAPELEEMLSIKKLKVGSYKPGKADVFSLGMTILQMLTLDELTTLNIKAHNYQLIQKVNDLPYDDWVKNLLRSMLHPERKQRSSFNKCLRYLPASVTTVNN